MIEEGAKLQPRLMEKSREMDAEMRKRWTDAGGEFVSLSPEDQARVMQLLGGVGEEVTKDNPAVNAFYKRLLAVSQKNN